jgi:4-carboxymuconolactone decarboxylase
MTSRFDTGTRTRRAVLGDAHVDRSVKNRTPFDAEFITLITESAWGSVWSRETISKRERSMITLAILASLGHHEEFVLHLKATRNTGASMEDIKDALLHVAIYAGVPAANTAFRIAKQVYAEMAQEADSGEAAP